MRDSNKVKRKIALAQKYFEKYDIGKSLVDELIQERRKEATIEMMEFGGPISSSFFRKYLQEVFQFVSKRETEVIITIRGTPVVKITNLSPKEQRIFSLNNQVYK